MDSKKLRIVEETLRQIAEREGVAADEVRENIRAAIAAGMSSPSPFVQEYWKSIPHEGGEPTPEEVVLYLAEEACRRMQTE